jgi:hypothetical protein
MTASAFAHNWRLGDRPDLRSMNVVNRLLKMVDMRGPGALPCFDGATRLIVGSDYGGQHADSQYESLAFVVADATALGPWFDARARCREAHLPDGRRMSFKSLNDRLRVAALPDFLSAADHIPGLLLVALFDKRIGSIFASDEDQAVLPAELQRLVEWPVRTQERMLRVCHILALILAGLTRELQNILWITDEDAIAANAERHTLFTRAFGIIASHYLEHGLGHLRVATTASDTGDRNLEDFVAVADLAAGAVCHVVNAYGLTGLSEVPGLVVPPPRGAPLKVEWLLNWFSNDCTPLRRLILSFEVIDNSPRLKIRHLELLGSNGLFGSLR